MVKTQKGSKDIGKTVHVTSVNCDFMKLRENFLSAKNKNNDFIQKLFSPKSGGRHFEEYHYACRCFPASKQCMSVVLLT